MTISNTWQWWQQKRLAYNVGLVIAGLLAFIAYCIVGEIFIAPHQEFEVTLFTIMFQGIGYLFMMLLANFFYTLGYLIDRYFNKSNSEPFRINLYRLGYWFSVFLPFSIPAILIILYW